MEFCYPQFQVLTPVPGYLPTGTPPLAEIMPLTNTTSHPSMGMNIAVYHLCNNDFFTLHERDEEMAIVFIEGKFLLSWQCHHEFGLDNNGEYVDVQRPSCIDDPGYCLHVPRNTRVTMHGTGEILVQTAPNSEPFEPVLYTPENTRVGNFGEGQFEGKALRRVTTYFDIHNAPYSNMVCGEIVQPQGGWSSYPPHEHPHPEVYYYRFDKPQGFGACFLDDDVYKIRDRSFAAIEGGKYHPQVTAPGYAMMYVWMFRHFDGYPWDDRNLHPDNH